MTLGARLRRDRGAWLVLAVLCLGAAIFFAYQTRGTTFWFDEWEWIGQRRGNDVGTFLDPHNQHLSLVPIALYRLLFATVGLDDYRPYRALVIAAHIGVVVLVFAYARTRIGAWLALAPAALLLFFGPGWQEVLWPFQVAWLIAIGAGVLALMALDRRTRGGDVLASGLLLLAISSAGIGVPFLLAAIVDVLRGPRGRRGWWIVGVPLVLYALWWLGYESGDTKRVLFTVPSYVATAAAGTVGSLAGLAGVSAASARRGVAAAPLAWGAPLLVIVVLAMIWRLRRLGRIETRLIALLVGLVGFWTLTAVQRGAVPQPAASRYLYPAAVLLLLAFVELARGWRPSRTAAAILGLAVFLACLSNVQSFRNGGSFLRAEAAAPAARSPASTSPGPRCARRWPSARCPASRSCRSTPVTSSRPRTPTAARP